MAMPTSTPVYDTYWRFAAERLAMYRRRLEASAPAPWTSDAILASFRFTNAFRAADRVSQYLIREVQYDEDRSQDAKELFFRTILFKLFNKVETWEALERENGPLAWKTVDLERVDSTLTLLMQKGRRIYSAAYIMPAPRRGASRKHTNHLALLAAMMDDRLPDRLAQAPDLNTVYESLAGYGGIGRFLACQYTFDLNYSAMLDFEEGGFVVAGPGALDGLSKCFTGLGGRTPEAVIHWVCERQEDEFAKRGLAFPGLFGRRLQPIDCQNLFCEISKYARVAHPEAIGIARRTRIKQTYAPSGTPLAPPFFPPRWSISV